ncbi:MAG: FKBP-type peptidyl-prolyl cis-trans isomerase [Haliscomenobacteraceae bacterium CHB4]|nr:FKBP-type 22 kDa peptidyl-prolyl cis-trans isomerase [Saprospiraceae bacterium]MCE7925451.1 FKBP-type peptidyl-prolyl cis-trans isomerase [Haliscomenobacteraceae bacterium CHB4]
MKKTLLLLFVAAMTTGLFAQSKVTLTNAKDSASYAYGIVLANSIKRQLSSDLSRDVLIAALNGALKDENMLFTPEAANKIFSDYNRAMQAKASERIRKEGQEFLEQNKKRKEVTTTASGLQYEVLKRGTGTESPKETDKVEVHYHGTLINGEVFDSSVERGQPAQFGLNQVIKGWTEGLQYMKEGDKFKFYLPADLAYGERSAGAKIKPGSTLVFEVELLKILK